MEPGDSPASRQKVRFKEPPSFQVVQSNSKRVTLGVFQKPGYLALGCCVRKVAPCDQAVPEGQDVVISAMVGGQPAPMVHWWV